MTRRRDWARVALLVIAGPALLAFHTWVFSATIDFGRLDAYRRLWKDLAVATASFVDATQGPATEVVSGPETDLVARGLILERIANQGLSPTRPLETVRKIASFVSPRLRPEPNPYDDRGRAVLLGLAFRVVGGIAPFLILWLAFMVAAPALAWTALELCAAGRFLLAAIAVLLIGLSPFVVETLALTRYPVGFYLAGVLLVPPLAVYARLHPSPTLIGLAVRVVVASALLAICAFCRSSAAVLLPGFVLAVWLGVCRISPSPKRRIAWTAAAAILLGLPCGLVPGAQQNDMWQPVWEGLGDFDRTHGFTWADSAATQAVQREGVPAIWTPESEVVLRDQVVGTIAREPGWYAGILTRRLLSTVALWRLWPFGPLDGDFIRRHSSPNEGVIDKYWTYVTTADHLGIADYCVELPIPLMVAPTLLLLALAWRGERAAAAREALVVLACPAVATLVLPVIITTAGGQEGQGFALVHLLAAAFLVDVLARRPSASEPVRP